MTLICLPFAGGNRHSFRTMLQLLNSRVQTITLELPGRGAKISQPHAGSIEAVVELLFEEIKHQLNDPYAFYGHSMGGLMTYLLTHRIISAGLPAPELIFLSGCKAPSQLRSSACLHQLPDEELVATIAGLGGVPPSLLENKEMMDFFLPILRADLSLIERYEHQVSPAFDIPVHCWIGDAENVSAEQAAAWQETSTYPLQLEILPGGHFFIFEQTSVIMENMNTIIENTIIKETTTP